MKRKLLLAEMSYPDYLDEYISNPATDKEACITNLTQLVLHVPTQLSEDSNYYFLQLWKGLQKPKDISYVRRCIFDKLSDLLKAQNKMPQERFDLTYSCAQILVWGHVYLTEHVNLSGFPLRFRQNFNNFNDDQWRAISLIMAHRKVNSCDMSGNELFQFNHWQIFGTRFAKTSLTSLNLAGNRFYSIGSMQCQAFALCLSQLPIKHLDLGRNSLYSLSDIVWQALLHPDMNHSQITSINLDNNDFSSATDSWQGLTNFLKQFPLLKELSMRWNNVGNIGNAKWKRFCDFIEHSKVTTIYFDTFTLFSSEREKELKTILQKNIYKEFLWGKENEFVFKIACGQL